MRRAPPIESDVTLRLICWLAVTLPTTGTYSVFIVPTGSYTGSATLQLFSATDLSISGLTIGGSAVTAGPNVPGQNFLGTVSGTAGQQISLNVTSDSIGGASFYIIPPGGTVSTAIGSVYISYGQTSGIIADVILPTTGTYSVFIVPTGSYTGSVTLQLWNLSDMSSTVNTSDTYATTVLGDAPQMYWRLDESAPATAANAVPTVKYGVSGPTSPDTGITFNDISYVSTTSQVSDPSIYSVEIWFKTTTTSGGKLIGFGSAQTGSSGSYDRQLYMTNSGQLVFGQYSGGIVSVTSSGSYNDGSWHYAVGSYNGSAIVLYVDGSQVGSTSSGSPQNYSGYWRLIFDNLSGWPSAPSSYYFQGSVGEAAVYSSALTSTEVSNHYAAAGGGSYDSTVIGDSPTSYWKLNESSGPTLADATGSGNTGTAEMGSNNGLYEGTLTYSQSGAIATDHAVLLDGSSAYVTTLVGFNNPTIYSIEIWFKTTTTSGGKLAGFGSSETGGSSNYDRHLYMTNSGQLIFGQDASGSLVTVTSSGSYNDGAWHHAVGTYNGSSIVLYVDGSQVASTSSGAPQNYSGYWRLGYDNLSGWPSAPSSYYFAGTIDEAAVYNYALSGTQVSNHYSAR